MECHLVLFKVFLGRLTAGLKGAKFQIILSDLDLSNVII